MSADLNDNLTSEEEMEYWEPFKKNAQERIQSLTREKRKLLAKEIKVPIKLIDEISAFISQYKPELHEGFKEYEGHYTITIDGKSIWLTKRTLASLSLLWKDQCLRENKYLPAKELILDKEGRYPVQGDLLQPYIQRVILRLEELDLILPLEEAYNVLHPEKRQGNRSHDETALHHTIVREAANILKRNGYADRYAKLLSMILPHFRIRGITSNNIRKIVNT